MRFETADVGGLGSHPRRPYKAADRPVWGGLLFYIEKKRLIPYN